MEDLAPQGALEEGVVGKIMVDAWRLRRVPCSRPHCIDAHRQDLIIEELMKAARVTRTRIYI